MSEHDFEKYFQRKLEEEQDTIRFGSFIIG